MTNNEVENFFKGKKIILIGRSPYVIKNPTHKKQGEFIDSFDIIIRVKSAYPGYTKKHIFEYISDDHFIFPEFQSLLGKRCTIVYGYRTDINRISKRIVSYKKMGGMIFGSWGIPDSEVDINILNENGIEIYTIPETTIIPCKKQIKQIAKEMGYWNDKCLYMPYLGMTVLNDILSYDIQEIHLLGFTSFQLKSDIKSSGSQHCVNSNWEWLKRKIICDNRIKIDSLLYDLVYNKQKMESLRRDDFI